MTPNNSRPAWECQLPAEGAAIYRKFRGNTGEKKVKKKGKIQLTIKFVDEGYTFSLVAQSLYA